jgi:hypothetical protein
MGETLYIMGIKEKLTEGKHTYHLKNTSFPQNPDLLNKMVFTRSEIKH